MARRRASVALLPVLAAAALDPGAAVDDLEADILDATATLLATRGLRAWSLDDVAERAGVGRTTVYRRFAGRDDLVHAVLVRELRSTIEAMAAAIGSRSRLEDRLAAAAVVAFARLEGSVVDQLLRSDPATFLPWLTTEAGPLLAAARTLLVAAARNAGVTAEAARLEAAAEVAARLGLSFVLTRDTVLPVRDDPEAAAEVVRAFVRPVLRSLQVRSPSR